MTAFVFAKRNFSSARLLNGRSRSYSTARRGVRATGLIIGMVGFALATPVLAEEGEPSNGSDWAVSMSVGLGGFLTDLGGSVESTVVSTGEELIAGGSGAGERFVSPVVGVLFEGRTPEFQVGRLAPQLFATFELLPNFSVSKNLAGDGDPEGPRVPAGPIVPEAGIGGQGSRTRVETSQLAFGAGLGVAIPFEFADTQFRFKAAAKWVRLELDVEGDVFRAIKPADDDPFFRGIRLGGSDTIVLDGVGPAIELEAFLGEYGPVSWSYFANVSAYRMIGDDNTEIRDSVTITDQLGTESYEARWTAEVDPWLYRLMIGARLSFDGF